MTSASFSFLGAPTKIHEPNQAHFIFSPFPSLLSLPLPSSVPPSLPLSSFSFSLSVFISLSHSIFFLSLFSSLLPPPCICPPAHPRTHRHSLTMLFVPRARQRGGPARQPPLEEQRGGGGHGHCSHHHRSPGPVVAAPEEVPGPWTCALGTCSSPGSRQAALK